MTAPLAAPRLVQYSLEDVAAKGLRAFSEASSGPQRPLHLTVTEMIALKPLLALQATRGAGKTTLAQWLRTLFARPDALQILRQDVIRNPQGDHAPQSWNLPQLAVLVDPDAAALAQAPDACLAILDGKTDMIDAAVVWQAGHADRRLLMLIDENHLRQIRLPQGIVINRLMDLPRAALNASHRDGSVAAQDWHHAGQFALAQLHGGEGDPLALARQGIALPAWAQDDQRAVELSQLSAADIIAQLDRLPLGALQKLAQIWGADHRQSGALARALIENAAGLDFLLVAEKLASVADTPELATKLVAALAGAPAALRRLAGEALSRLGDPRDLGLMLEIPAGSYPQGGQTVSGTADPAYVTDLPAFKIAAYPVTIAAYAEFAHQTNRTWLSPHRDDPDRQNQPATDLTWHDAGAYCAWLTRQWQDKGLISEQEILRLPTEREWEAAARGPRGLAWPWGQAWAAEHCNGEETGFNDLCAVGLFPEGASPFGALDMAGNIWEWCLTLWGADMAVPYYLYPWRDDGREALDAAGDIRRVLRGGSFVSPGEKTNAVYRGSLEPAGSWRGNGFRIVLAQPQA